MSAGSGAYDGVALPIADAQFFIDDRRMLCNINAIRNMSDAGAFPASFFVFPTTMAQMLVQRASSQSICFDIFIYGFMTNANALKFQASRNLFWTPIKTQTLKNEPF
jgi:hypothetical protein